MNDNAAHEETMTLINRLANERQKLYLMAGEQKLTQTQRDRIPEITDELAVLWDRYRREYVARSTTNVISLPAGSNMQHAA